MDLQLATFEDIIQELERRKVTFLLVGVEPTNRVDANTVHISASATSRIELVRLVRMLRSAMERDSRSD
ncbi:MAG: hypothetical protein KDB27_11850 [Planctomycetales bacterium]|nr:hypothetical protein [Planctomycetales bacterium]